MTEQYACNEQWYSTDTGTGTGTGPQYWYWTEGFLKQSNKKVWKALQSRKKIHFSQANVVRTSYYSPKPIDVWTRKKILLFYFYAFVSITDIYMTDIVSVFFY